MTTIRNRRGSVLLMAIGLLAIIAIMASTFLIVSNLDAQEAQTLSVKAQADPVAQGVLASIMSAIATDRHADLTNGPYGVTATPTPPIPAPVLADYMDYPDDITPGLDRWLAREYDWGEKIGLQVSHVDTDTGDTAGYRWDGFFSKFNTITTDGTALVADGQKYVDTDGDKIVDARLYNTRVLCPGASQAQDANYWAAARVVDLGARICVNTAGGGILTGNTGTGTLVTAYQPVPTTPTPAMIDLNSYIGSASFAALHDTAGSAQVKGRCGDVSASGKPKSMRTYDRYGGQNLLAPVNPATGTASTTTGYTPFTSGDEMFLLMCDTYVAGSAKYAGRVYDLLNGASALKSAHTWAGYLYSTGEASDEVRRHLTTLSSVSSSVRHARATSTETEPVLKDEFRYLRPITTAGDCASVYKRMYRMLTELNIGRATGDEGDVAKVRRKLAASFAANLWAYQANGLAGQPWAFTPSDDATITAYGLRQDLVITQAFARHKKMTVDQPADADWAWGAAVEIANPTPAIANLTEYKLVKTLNGADVATFPLIGTLGAALTASATPQKRVIYSYDFGPKPPDAGSVTKFFGVAAIGASWTRDNGMSVSFAGGLGKAAIELRHTCNGVDVTIDRVAADTKELGYDLNGTVEDIKVKTFAGTDSCVNIRRDDRFKAGTGQRQAFYNLALYKSYTTAGTPTGYTLGSPCGLADGAIIQGGDVVVYSPAIFRPRDVAVKVGDPNATKDANMLDDYRLTSLGELTNLFLAGPIVDTAMTPSRMGFPQRIVAGTKGSRVSVVFEDLSTRGRLPIRPSDTGMTSAVTQSYDGTPWAAAAPAMVYPDVTSGAMFGEFYTRLNPHYARPNQEVPRIYGQINVNTASKDVLMRLPWPSETAKNGLGLNRYTLAYNREDAVDYILAYRDKRSIGRAPSSSGQPIPDYLGNTTIPGRASSATTYVKNSIGGLRAGSNYRGFLTPGEVAIPLGDYMEYLLTKTLPTGITTADAIRKDVDFARARNSLYTAVADCLTTRSDVFGVYIHVQHDSDLTPRYKWRYLAVIDRSCVVRPTDVPAVLMFTEIK